MTRGAPSRGRERALLAAALAAALAVGGAVRLSPWRWVYGGERVRLVGDGDPAYHLVRAGALAAGGLGAAWRDPWLGWPGGAAVPWPPLFDGLLVASGWLAAGGAPPDAPALERGAALVPVVLGLATVALVAWLGAALLGGAPWADAALLLALLPSHAMLTVLGRPDQHAAEPLLLGLVLLAAARLAGAPAGGRGRWAVALLGLAVALSFWNWSGSALYLAVVAAFAAAWHALAPAGDPAPGRAAARLAAGLAGGALLLGASVVALGPPGALGEASLSGVSGLQPALAAGAALACAALAAARARAPSAGPAARIAVAAAALAGPAAALALAPWSRTAIGHGVGMLGARGWYLTIVEFRPLLLSGLSPLADDLRSLAAIHGLALLAVPATLPLLLRRARGAAGAARGPVLLLAVFAAGALGLALARNRFVVYLALAEALLLALAARELAAAVARRWPARRRLPGAARGALLLAAVAPILPGLADPAWAVRSPARILDLAPLARLAGALPTLPGREGVLCPWSDGHDVRRESGRPVVTSPFGVEGGAGTLEDADAFYRATDPAIAEAILARRRVGFLLLGPPLDELLSLEGLGPPDDPPLYRARFDPVAGPEVRLLPRLAELVVTRLYLWDGRSGAVDGRLLPGGPPALDGFRLVGEGPSLAPWGSVEVALYKLFEPVAGAKVRVTGAAPGGEVVARVELRTATGRRFELALRRRAGPDGAATLRLPYATGFNGEVLAAPWAVGDGRRAAALTLSDREVLLGAARPVRLAP